MKNFFKTNSIHTISILLIFSGIFYLYFFMVPQAHAQDIPGLVGHWKFDEESGTTAADSSKNGEASGTLFGNPIWTAGKIGNALSFKGTEDYVKIGSNTMIKNLSAFTWSAWIKPTGWGEGNNGTIISDSSGIRILRLYNQEDQKSMEAKVQASVINSRALSEGNSIPINDWTHVLVTYDDDGDRKIRIYKNRVLFTVGNTASGTSITQEGDIFIGSKNISSGFFAGLIDDVRIYNRVLSSEEITTLYNYQGPPPPPPPPPPAPPPSGGGGGALSELLLHLPEEGRRITSPNLVVTQTLAHRCKTLQHLSLPSQRHWHV